MNTACTTATALTGTHVGTRTCRPSRNGNRGVQPRIAIARNGRRTSGGVEAHPDPLDRVVERQR